jgi:hypothetical protein
MKTSITKSKAGHYTVTIRGACKTIIFHQRLINTIQNARAIATAFKQMELTK